MPTPTPKTAAVTVCRLLSPELCLCDMLMMPSRWLRFAAEVSRSRNHSLSTYAQPSQPKPFPRRPLGEFERTPTPLFPWLKHHRPPGQCDPLLCLDARLEMPREYFQSVAVASGRSARRSPAYAQANRSAVRNTKLRLPMPLAQSILPDKIPAPVA